MSEELWICDHAKTCKNIRCNCRTPRTRDIFFGRSLFDNPNGWYCKYHNTGDAVFSDTEKPCVKAIPYKDPTEITHNGKVYRRVGDDEVIKEGDVHTLSDGTWPSTVSLSIGFTGRQAKKMWSCIKFYTPKEEPVKYISKKDITLEAMIKAGAQVTCDDFRAFADKAFQAGYKWTDVIPLEKALEWKRTDFLLNHGFYREEGRCYRKGQRFTNKSTGGTYVLAVVMEGYVGMINIGTGNRYGEMTPCKNVNDILQSEMRSDWISEFELID